MVYVTHRDIVHHNVLHLALVHLLEGQSAAIGKRAVGERDVTVAPIRLCTQLETSANPVNGFWHIGAIQQRATLITRDITVGDGDMLTGNCLLKGIA